MRRLVLSLGLLAGCGYPGFAFPGDAAAAGSTADDTDAPSVSDASTDAPGVSDSSDAPAPGGDDADACAGGACAVLPSCAALHAAYPSLPSGAYTLDPGSGPFAAYCEMKADGGGWTLALKIDGTQSTFAYASALWTDDTLLAPESTDLSTTEAKHASFVRLPTSELRVAMLTGGVMRAIHFPLVRPSLKDAFAGGRLATSIGRSAWLSLLDAPALQPNCNDEGFDIDYTAAGPYPRVRLGIVGNDQSDCGSPDSYLGIGAEFITTHPCFGPNVEVVVGNVARKGCFGVTEDRTITAFAYVFVR